MRIIEQCTCGAHIDVRAIPRRARADVAAFRSRHIQCEPAVPDDSGHASTQLETAAPYRGPSIGFTIPDAEPAWEDRA